MGYVFLLGGWDGYRYNVICCFVCLLFLVVIVFYCFSGKWLFVWFCFGMLLSGFVYFISGSVCVLDYLLYIVNVLLDFSLDGIVCCCLYDGLLFVMLYCLGF